MLWTDSEHLNSRERDWVIFPVTLKRFWELRLITISVLREAHAERTAEPAYKFRQHGKRLGNLPFAKIMLAS